MKLLIVFFRTECFEEKLERYRNDLSPGARVGDRTVPVDQPS